MAQDKKNTNDEIKVDSEIKTPEGVLNVSDTNAAEKAENNVNAQNKTDASSDTYNAKTGRILPAKENPSEKFSFRKALNKATYFTKKDRTKKEKTVFNADDSPKTVKEHLKAAQEEMIEAFKYICKRENLKKAYKNKQNIAIGLSALALALACGCTIRSCSSPIVNEKNAFIKLNAENVNGAHETKVNLGNLQTPSNTAFEQLANENAQKSDASLKFANKEDFKSAVADAIYELKTDQMKAEVKKLYDKYASASNLAPKDKKIYGNLDARFEIVEFSDLECPYCKTFSAIPKEIVDISNNQVKLRWVNFPLNFHDPMATKEAVALECMYEQKGNHGFWVGLDKLFSTTQSNGRGSPLLPNFAESLLLDKDKFNTCIVNPDTVKKVRNDMAFATQNGVNSTPTIMIIDHKAGNQRMLNGAVPAESIIRTIEELNLIQDKESADTQENNGPTEILDKNIVVAPEPPAPVDTEDPVESANINSNGTN